MMRRSWIALGAAVWCLPAAGQAQGADLSRLVAQYRTGSATQAVEGLQQLLRLAATNDQRAITELHLGMALLRVRPADAPSSLRRSIALDPDLQPDAGATVDERSAWAAARAELPVPVELRFEPASLILGAKDSLGVLVTTASAGSRSPARVRLRVIRPAFRDTVTVWSGRTDVRSRWDGTVSTVPLPEGRVPVIVEVEDDATSLVIQWRRLLEVSQERVVEPLAMSPRPVAPPLLKAVTTVDRDAAARTVKRGGRWLLAGLGIAAISSALVPTAIDYSAPGSLPRWGVAAGYGLGLAATLGGVAYIGSRINATPNTTVIVPDEPAMRQFRAATIAWAADSARISGLNTRLQELTKISVRVGALP
jgi:hypothetical protein